MISNEILDKCNFWTGDSEINFQTIKRLIYDNNGVFYNSDKGKDYPDNDKFRELISRVGVTILEEKVGRYWNESRDVTFTIQLHTGDIFVIIPEDRFMIDNYGRPAYKYVAFQKYIYGAPKS